MVRILDYTRKCITRGNFSAISVNSFIVWNYISINSQPLGTYKQNLSLSRGNCTRNLSQQNSKYPYVFVYLYWELMLYINPEIIEPILRACLDCYPCSPVQSATRPQMWRANCSPQVRHVLARKQQERCIRIRGMPRLRLWTKHVPMHVRQAAATTLARQSAAMIQTDP